MISVIFISSQMTRGHARKFALEHPDLKVIEYREGINPKYIRSKFTFVQLVPEGKASLDPRTRRVSKESIKEVMR